MPIVGPRHTQAAWHSLRSQRSTRVPRLHGPHAYRRIKRSAYRISRGPKRRTKRVASRGEHRPTTTLDRTTNKHVMAGQRDPHRAGMPLPQRSRTLNVGEQKTHRSRRPAPINLPHPQQPVTPDQPQTPEVRVDTLAWGDARA